MYVGQMFADFHGCYDSMSHQGEARLHYSLSKGLENSPKLALRHVLLPKCTFHGGPDSIIFIRSELFLSKDGLRMMERLGSQKRRVTTFMYIYMLDSALIPTVLLKHCQPWQILKLISLFGSCTFPFCQQHVFGLDPPPPPQRFTGKSGRLASQKSCL